MTEHERIWLEPAGAPDRCWCQDNQWGDEGVEYVLVSTLESLQRENAIMQERTADYPTISARLHDREKARDAEQKACREAIARAEAAEAEVKRLRGSLISAKTRMRNCRGAIESDQVVDKDVHGSLQNGIRDIQEALASTGVRTQCRVNIAITKEKALL